MPIGLVTLTAYITMDLLKGAPVYEAMLEQLMPEVTSGSDVLTLIEIPVSEKIAGRQGSRFRSTERPPNHNSSA